MQSWKENLIFFQKFSPVIYMKMSSPLAAEDIYESSWHPHKKMFSVKYENKDLWLGSSLDAKREAEKLFAACDENAALVIVLGVGNIKLFPRIKKHFRNLQRLIVVEPSKAIFNFVMQTLSVKKLFKDFFETDISIIVDEPVENIEGLYRNFCSAYPGATTAVICPLAYSQLFPLYKKRIGIYASNVSAQLAMNINTNNHFKYASVVNQWRNLALNGPSAYQLAPILEKIPVIIVSAGPSLSKNIHLLKSVGDKAFILAVGSAMGILEKEGIVPHARMAVDGSVSAERIFAGVDHKACPLLYSNGVYYKTAAFYKNNCFDLCLASATPVRRYVYNYFNQQLPHLSSGNSVANTGVFLALTLNCKKIILLGQDLCFSQGKNYAEGSWRSEKENQELALGANMVEERNIYGEQVYTNNVFLSMKHTLELASEMAQMKNKVINFINATEGGLPIKGYVNKTFLTVLQEDLKDEFPDLRQHIKELLTNPQDILPKDKLDEAVKLIQQELFTLQEENSEFLALLAKCTTEKDLPKIKRQQEKISESKVYKVLFERSFPREEDNLYKAIYREGFLSQKKAYLDLAEAIKEFIPFVLERTEEFLEGQEKQKVVYQIVTV